MPIKSKAQRRKFAHLLVEGAISPETFEKWNRGAGGAELPERLHPKVATRRKGKRKRKATRKRMAKPKRKATRKRSSPRRAAAKPGKPSSRRKA
jgi:hypothetical protein